MQLRNYRIVLTALTVVRADTYCGQPVRIPFAPPAQRQVAMSQLKVSRFIVGSVIYVCYTTCHTQARGRDLDPSTLPEDQDVPGVALEEFLSKRRSDRVEARHQDRLLQPTQ